MEETLLKILIISYGATGIIDTIAYWPTIKDLWFLKKPSANIQSYILWTITTGIGFLYSLLILPDWLFRFVSGMMFLANVVILILSIRLKSR